jgi:predicted TIM-barrel fold metal-dependent hydrolase
VIIDCHYHLDPELKPVDALLAEMDASGVDRIALMGKQIEPMPDPSRLLVATMQFCLSRGPLRRLVKPLVANFTEEGAIVVPGGVHPIDPDPPNRPVFETVRAHLDRFLGWVFVNPRGNLDPLEELERWADSPGFIGVKAHPFWNRHTPLELAPVAERLVKLGKPMLIHCGFEEDGDFRSLVAEVPGLQLILAHAAFPEYKDAWPVIRDSPNVCVDLSQTSYVGRRMLRDVVDALGPDRCLYGTDGPYGLLPPYEYSEIKNRIEATVTDPGARRRILGENMSDLAGL